jgi:hypothetical protein
MVVPKPGARRLVAGIALALLLIAEAQAQSVPMPPRRGIGSDLKA